MPSAKATRRPKSGQDFLSGNLLIAMPNMRDPRFQRSLILLCAHDDEHAMGVIVNKPLGDVELGELLEQLDIDPKEGVGGDPVYFGGPVQTERGLVLHSLDYRVEATAEICPGVGLTASRDILLDIGGRNRTRPSPRQFIVAIGHAGWSGGQLEAEFALNAWVHSKPDPSLIFTGDPGASWSNALAALGVSGAMLSPEWAARPGNAPLN